MTGRAITVFFEKDGSNNTASNFYKPNKKKVEKESSEQIIQLKREMSFLDQDNDRQTQLFKRFINRNNWQLE